MKIALIVLAVFALSGLLALGFGQLLGGQFRK
jgi:hypothetical protein